MPRSFSWIHRQAVDHGVNDSEFPGKLSSRQISKAINYDLSKEGVFDSRGGSKKTSASATGASETVHLAVEYRTVSSGTVTRKFLVFAGTSLYNYDTSAKTYSTLKTGLAGVKPSIAVFRDDAGLDVIYYCDGTNFEFYDGSAIVSILAKFQAGAAGAKIPRYIHAQHERLWAGGGTCDQNRVFYSPGNPAHPEQNWGGFDYVTLKGSERFTGIRDYSKNVVIGAEDNIYIITGRGGHSGDPFIVFPVSPGIGITSHWSMISYGGSLYFANSNGINIGRLRAALEDGLEVENISFNMKNTFKTIADGAWDNIEGVFFEEKQQIYWTMKTTDASNPDNMLVYSTALSNPNEPKPIRGLDIRFVWAGYHTGLDYNSIGVIKDSNGKEKLYIGGSDGFVREYYSDFLDDRSSADVGGSSTSYEINPREEDEGTGSLLRGPGGNFRVHSAYPSVHMRKNGTLQWEVVINQSSRKPEDGAITITLDGNIPYFHDTDDDVTSTFGSIIFRERPIVVKKFRVGIKCKSFLPIFTNVGGDVDGEAFSFSGISYLAQRGL